MIERYTQVDYTQPLTSRVDAKAGISFFVSKITLWACNECSALVMDQAQHDWWHRNYLHRDDAKRWWQRRRNG